jgi:hypothetical protein
MHEKNGVLFLITLKHNAAKAIALDLQCQAPLTRLANAKKLACLSMPAFDASWKSLVIQHESRAVRNPLLRGSRESARRAHHPNMIMLNALLNKVSMVSIYISSMDL